MPSLAQVATTPAELVSLFEAVCLKTFPDPTRVDQVALKRGFEQINEAQWAIGDTATSILFFRNKAKGKKAELWGKKLGISDSWNKVSANMNAHAKRTRNQDGCAVLTIGVPPNGIAQLLAPIVKKYAGSSSKFWSQGRLTQVKGVISGVPFVLVVNLVGSNASYSQTLISIIKVKAS